MGTECWYLMHLVLAIPVCIFNMLNVGNSVVGVDEIIMCQKYSCPNYLTWILIPQKKGFRKFQERYWDIYPIFISL